MQDHGYKIPNAQSTASGLASDLTMLAQRQSHSQCHCQSVKSQSLNPTQPPTAQPVLFPQPLFQFFYIVEMYSCT